MWTKATVLNSGGIPADEEPMGTTSWRELGHCKGAEQGVFFPEDDEDPGDGAKAMSAQCAVQGDVPRGRPVHRENLGGARLYGQRTPAPAPLRRRAS